MKYADILLPLAISQSYTFGIPLQLQDKLRTGQRVEVQFGKKKIYSGIVYRIHDRKPEVYEVKPIRAILEDEPVVSELQLRFWDWIASYYMCTNGEVMDAALPSYMKLESETYVVLNDENWMQRQDLDDDEFLVLQALQIHREKQEKAKTAQDDQANTSSSGEGANS